MHLAELGKTFDDVYYKDPDWVHRHVRRRVPPAPALEKRLQDWFAHWKQL